MKRALALLFLAALPADAQVPRAEPVDPALTPDAGNDFFMRGKNLGRWGNDPEHVNHWGRRSFARFIGARFEIVAMPQVFPWTMALARKK